MYITRMRDRLLFDRIARSRKNILLLGPRQVGKSTLCRSLAPRRIVDLADEQVYLSHAKDAGLLKRELAAAKPSGVIVIDEVQRLPSMLNTVQSLADNPSNAFRFVLTGSSARKLKRGGANLLPGRVILEHMDPFTYSELGDAFDLARALQVGMLPGIYLGGEESIATLDTYVEVYLREEIRTEALVRNLGDYARFLDVAAILSGQWLNYSKISSDTEIPKETIRRYVTLLEDTLLMFRLPAFAPRGKISRRLSQRDRFLIFDIGVRNALLGIHRRPVTPDQKGPVFEQWLILQMIYLNRVLRKGWRMSSYRTEGGAEVDLVIEREDDILGIEIKSGRGISRADTRDLASLVETVGRYKPVKNWLVYGGDRRQILDNGVHVLPYLEALEELARS
jgi:predicted AAA+ superfamily ATPase